MHNPVLTQFNLNSRHSLSPLLLAPRVRVIFLVINTMVSATPGISMCLVYRSAPSEPSEMSTPSLRNHDDELISVEPLPCVLTPFAP